MKELRRVRVIWENQKKVIIQYGFTWINYKKGRPVSYDREFLTLKTSTPLELRCLLRSLTRANQQPTIDINNFPHTIQPPPPSMVLKVACEEVNISIDMVRRKYIDPDLQVKRRMVICLVGHITDIKLEALGEMFDMQASGIHRAMKSIKFYPNYGTFDKMLVKVESKIFKHQK